MWSPSRSDKYSLPRDAIALPGAQVVPAIGKAFSVIPQHFAAALQEHAALHRVPLQCKNFVVHPMS
jgi:hypothetical protein